jgi:transcription-repair coupling factor (superfamily II helicase)
LGIEKIILKNKTLLIFFVANPQSPFYQSAVFGKIVQWLQQNPKKATMKEAKNRLTMSFPNIASIAALTQRLKEIESFNV